MTDIWLLVEQNQCIQLTCMNVSHFSCYSPESRAGRPWFSHSFREMVCSEGVNGAGEYSCCIVVNAACCTPANFKELAACNWLAGSTHLLFFCFEHADKYQMKNIMSWYCTRLTRLYIIDHDSSKLYHQEDSLAAFTKEPCYRGMLSSCDCIILWKCIHERFARKWMHRWHPTEVFCTLAAKPLNDGWMAEIWH